MRASSGKPCGTRSLAAIRLYLRGRGCGRRKRPDVLITDIQIPFMGGLALNRLVLKEFPQTKVIIIFGYGDFEYVRQAIELGMKQYLLKPVTKKDLLSVLESVRTKIENSSSKKKPNASAWIFAPRAIPLRSSPSRRKVPATPNQARKSPPP